MHKSYLAGRVAVAVIACLPFTALAQGSQNNMAPQGDECISLMRQFDEAKSTNARALALRKSGGNNCADAAKPSKMEGIAQLKRALKMIGAKPM